MVGYMKKIIGLLLFVLVLLTASGCRYHDEDGIEYTLSDDETYYVLSYVGENIEEIVIPEYYNGKPVLEIGFRAFRQGKGLTDKNTKNPVNINTKTENIFE